MLSNLIEVMPLIRIGENVSDAFQPQMSRTKAVRLLAMYCGQMLLMDIIPATHLFHEGDNECCK